jgi:nitrous oxide reductase accessory protein NosL
MNRVKIGVTAVLSVFAIIFTGGFFVRAVAQEYKIPEGAKCAECGMRIDPKSPFVCLAVRNNGQVLYFDEPGELLHHIRNMKDIKDVRVKDYATGKWIDGRTAYYVKSKEFRTPMGWSIAAFASLKDAKAKGKAVPWDEAFSLVDDD